jgi:pentatricopeptide repeat protein
MGVIFELAGQVWKAIGVELVIFTVTICVTWAVRFTSKNVAKQPQKKVANTLADAATHASEKAAPKAYLPGSWRDAAARAAVGRDMEGRRTSEAVQHDTAERQPWQLIDDLFSLMHKAPGQKSTVQALQIYSQLRKQLGLGSDAADEQTAGVDKVISIADATRYAKHSAVDLYSTLVHCAVRAGQCHLVERLVDDMVHQGVTRSAAFYESTMKQLAGQKYYRLALNIYDRLQADGLEPSAVTCSCLISFATELGEHKRALDFFEKLSSKTTPSIRAFMTVLRVHAQQQDWSASLKTLRDMQQRGILLDSLTLNVVLATGVATDNLVEADELLAEADSMTPPAADVVSYNTIIKGFARRGDVKATSRLIARMKGRGLSPNAITYPHPA